MFLKDSAPVEELISNLDESNPLSNDHVLDLLELKVWTKRLFSEIDLELELAPEPPDGPVIFGAFSSYMW